MQNELDSQNVYKYVKTMDLIRVGIYHTSQALDTPTQTQINTRKC